jgi:O-antigen ligase
VKVQQKAVLLAGVSYIAMAIFHIPDGIFRHAFDKDAPAQLFALTVIAAIFAIYMALKPERYRFHRLAIYGAAALLLTQFTSLLMSGNLMGSLIGDAGRFVGTASVVALLAVSIFHTQFKYEAFVTLARFYLVAIEAVCLIGIAQHFNLIELPGDQGISSTLGNLDFFAAYIGTAFPIILFVALNSSRRTQYLLGAVALVNVYALRLAGPLQGYLDIAFTALGILILVARRYIPRREWTLNARTYLGTFAVIIWAEFIFLMPFLGHFVPVLGNDVQVKIRANFWLAGMRQFFAHPFIGVGPDQYGNYYEQYRTIDDIKQYSNILSNDAHSASVQTLATTGILGTLAFLFLLALVIRSFLILWDSRAINRKALFALGLYIFVYLTNSFISPFTLTHKYLFWAVCGFIVGQTYRLPSRASLPKTSTRFSALTAGAFLAFIAVIFVQGQLNYLTSIEKYAADNKAVINYKPSPVIPCMMYFDAELLMAVNNGNDYAIQFIRDELKQNPRCVSAQINLTRAAVNSGELKGLKKYVYQLYTIAPARSDTISFGMYYANRTGDRKLAAALEKTMKALGLTYIPGKLG